MNQLDIDTTIRVADGNTSVTIIGAISSGGQGEIYRVRNNADGRILALKWYTNPDIIRSRRFRNVLEENCRRHSLRRNRLFLWPIAITQTINGSYGYLMPLKSSESYYELGRYFCIDIYPDAYFRSWGARVTAAFEISSAFNELHSQNLTYQDINDGSFLIDPRTGHVEICDNDNVVFSGRGNGIAGKPHYMAPEVSAGHMPTCASDRLSLAIILYRIFAVDHPFEGRNTNLPQYTILTPEIEQRLFGSEAVFCHDFESNINAPLPEHHANSIFFWPLLSERLRTAFQQSLSRTSLAQPERRLSAQAWRSICCYERADIVTCRADNADDPVHDFLHSGPQPEICPLCYCRTMPEAFLRFDGFYNGFRYRLTDGKKLYLGFDAEPCGECVIDNYRGKLYPAIINISHRVWYVRTPDGKYYELNPGSKCHLIKDTMIIFGSAANQKAVVD